jgi:hypothetical protein
MKRFLDITPFLTVVEGPSGDWSNVRHQIDGQNLHRSVVSF